MTMVNGRLFRSQPRFGGVAAPPGSALLKRCVGVPALSAHTVREVAKTICDGEAAARSCGVPLRVWER